MSILKTRTSVNFAFASAFTLALASGISHAHDSAPTDDSETQLARFGGAMHLTASKCGGYSEQQLNELKTQQQQRLAESGMDDDSFDAAFTAGVREAEARWEDLSEKERKTACDEVRDSSNEMTQ